MSKKRPSITGGRKLVFHPEVLELQNYKCNCCSRGCRTFLVSVEDHERQSIEQQQSWRDKLGVDELFIRTRTAGKFGYALAKHPDGRCVFLDEDNLCLIHKFHGLEAKPIACQLYPFVFLPFQNTYRLGLRFDCPAVVDSTGKDLETYTKEIRRHIKKIVPANLPDIPPPPIYKNHHLTPDQFDAINEIFIKIIGSNALPFLQRMHWLTRFADHLRIVTWDNINDETFDELISMLHSGILTDIREMKPNRIPTKGKTRKLLGQIFFILSQSSTVITNPNKSIHSTLGERFTNVNQMRLLGKTTGTLPKLQPDWPNIPINLQQLETSSGPLSNDVQEMLSRYLICRIASLNYCGISFYNYTMLEGIQTLTLGIITIGWLMRIHAHLNNRTNIQIADCHQAILTVDSNLGYSPALGTGPHRYRLNMLTDHLENLIGWYLA